MSVLSTTTSLAILGNYDIQEGDLLLLDETEQRTAGTVTDVSTVGIHDIFEDGSAVATYTLDGNANDLGGTYNGTPSNITYGLGKFGQAAVFTDSSNSKVTTSINAMQQFSWSFWINIDDVSKHLNGGVSFGSILFGNPTQKRFEVTVSANNISCSTSNGSTEAKIVYDATEKSGQWIHCVAIGNVNSFSFYIDGNLVGTETFTYRTLSGNFQFGASTDGYGLNGKLDQIRIFNRALTEQEVKRLYYEGYKTVAIDPALSVAPSNAQVVSSYTDIQPDTWFRKPTDNDEVDSSTLQVTNGKLAFTNGRSEQGGYNVETQDFTGSIDFTGASDGAKYVAIDSLGNTKFYKNFSIGLYEKESADDNRLVFDTESGKWYETTGGELVTNGTFDNDTSGWTTTYWNGSNHLTPNPNITQENGSAKITLSSTYIYGSIEQSISSLILGKQYKVSFEYGGGIGDNGIRIGLGTETIVGANTWDTDDSFLLYSTINKGRIELYFTAPASIIYIRIGASSNNAGEASYVDNISVYKVEPTLGAELPNPICFLDTKPYQVSSGTPMDRLEDYPSVPKNVMENTYVDGDLEVSGEVKGKTINISNLPTVDPAIKGELWNSSGTVKISAGV